jgi:hypothetical protein
MSEKEARAKAEDALKGYKASCAKLVGSEYQVKLSYGKDEATVVIDAWDGEVVSTIRHKSAVALALKDPKKVAGLAIIIAVAIASAVFFEGFPDPAADLASLIGMTPEELSDMAGAAAGSGLFGGNVPEGCVSPAIFAGYQSQLSDRDFIAQHAYSDEAAKSAIERSCGGTVMMMLLFDHEGKDIVLGFTDAGSAAYLTDGTFCMCIETGASAG